MSNAREYKLSDGRVLYSAGKLAEALGIQTQTVRLHIRAGMIPPARFVRRREGNSATAMFTEGQIKSVATALDEAEKRGDVLKDSRDAIRTRIEQLWREAGEYGDVVELT